MKRLLLFLLLSLPCFGANTYYVKTDGDNGLDGLSWANAWLTLSNAEANVSSGDTIYIADGDYDEYVQVNGVFNLSWIATNSASVRAFRLDTQSNTLSGITLSKACDAGYRTWGAFLYMRPEAVYTTVTNCKFINTPWVEATNWSFNSTANTISSSDVDFLAAGFAPGCHVFWGGVSYTNGPFASWDYDNRGNAGRPTNVSTTTLTFSNGVISLESNPSTWSIIQAGSDQYHMRGVKMIVESGGTSYPTNCLIANCLFSNWFGIPITLEGGNHMITNCEFTALHGNSAILNPGFNLYIVSNHFHDCSAEVYYSQLEEELNYIGHTGNRYDYIHQFWSPQGLSTLWNTNVHIAGNWFENIEQPMGNIGRVTNVAGNSEFIYVQGNVFVGMSGAMDGGQDNTYIRSNTFYRCSYQYGKTHCATIGGQVADPATNFVFTHNLMVACGDHKSHTNEGYVTIANVGEDLFVTNNYVAGTEMANWNGMDGWSNSWGINGGDPLFVNEYDPKGPDGLPFTADDGLCLRPYSPAAGIGARSTVTNTTLLPFFRPLNFASNSLDYKGTNFNNDFHTNTPCFLRTGFDKTYDLGEALTNLPRVVQFDASNSISGTWSTNNWIGIKDFVWDFGDGSRLLWTKWPSATHTFLVTGQVSVTLWVTNSATNAASHTRNYRILPGTNFSYNVWYVATNGNDGGAGSYGDPFLTITNAAKQATAGDYICVLPGTYGGDMRVGNGPGVSGTAANPITMVWYDARTSVGVTNYSLNNWTFEGIEIGNLSPSAGNGHFYIPYAVTNTVLRNFFIHNGPYRNDTILVGTGCSNLLIKNCYFLSNEPFAGTVSISLARQVDFSENIIMYCEQQPDIRIDGNYVTIARNYGYQLGGPSNYHHDFVAYVSTDTSQEVCNYVVEQNWAEQADWDTQMTWEGDQDSQIMNGGSEPDDFNPNMTNIVVRNNVFIRYWNGINPADGNNTRIYNNLFYDCFKFGPTIVYGGHAQASMDMQIVNNAFVGCGKDPWSGWYANGFGIADTNAYQTNGTLHLADFNYVCHTNGFDTKSNWYAGAPVGSYKDLFGIPYAASNSWTYGANTVPITNQPATEPHGINGGDPGFSDMTNGNWLLLTNSILLGYGTNLSATGFNVDYYGRTRPTNWAIGPFEQADLVSVGDGEPEPPAVTNNTSFRLPGRMKSTGRIRWN